MDAILSTHALTKRFRSCNAVNQVNITVKQGDIYGFIGRNGAGKTTLLKMICGLSTPTSGDFSLFGYSGREKYELLSRIGCLIEAPGLYPNMTAMENLRIKAKLFGMDKKAYLEDILTLVGLPDDSKKVKNFSLGMKQRLGIGLALVGKPDLLLLDEPINGLDPQGIAEIRDIIRKLNVEQGITIVISSHILEELSKICTSYGIIHQGQLLEEMSHEELLKQCTERIEITVDHPETACPVLDAIGFQNYTSTRESVQCEAPSDTVCPHGYKIINRNTIYVYDNSLDIGTLAAKLHEAGLHLDNIGKHSETLEEYYLNLTGGQSHA